jgi:hypothetical protein
MGTASRLGMLAIGLGIGTAVAATPGTASATTDIDISIGGVDVFNGGGTATAISGPGDMAIAIGPNSGATAEAGFGDFASAFSTGPIGSSVTAGDLAPGASGSNFDFASGFGNDSDADAGGFGSSTSYSFDFASASGNVSVADAFGGSNDTATAFGAHVESLAGITVNDAPPANFDWASVWGSTGTPTTETTFAFAGGGLYGLGGSNDLAFVLDPFGIVGSDAVAGLGNNFDLAGALGDNLGAMATGSDFLSQILPFF